MPVLTKPGQFTRSFSKAVIVTAFLTQSTASSFSRQRSTTTQPCLPGTWRFTLPTLRFQKVTKPEVYLIKRILLNLVLPGLMKGNLFRCQWQEA